MHDCLSVGQFIKNYAVSVYFSSAQLRSVSALTLYSNTESDLNGDRTTLCYW